MLMLQDSGDEELIYNSTKFFMGKIHSTQHEMDYFFTKHA